LYLDCEDSITYTCNYTITNTDFTNNSAKINGGAIRFTYYKPNIAGNNTFLGNTADYGPNMASYPV
jgi:predicted outer membrane repeat protein